MKKKLLVLAALCALLAALVGCIGVDVSNGKVRVRVGNANVTVDTDGQDAYWDDLGDGASEGDGSIASDGIERIEIVWVAGEVHIEPGTGSSIELIETAEQPIAPEGRLRYRVTDGTLRIIFCKPAVYDGKLVHSKTLTVRLPKSLALETLTLDLVSADAEIADIAGKKLSVNGVSGDAAVSGGAWAKLDCDSVSGALLVTLPKLPDAIDFDSVSGDLKVVLPDNAGFSLKLDSVSGDVDCDAAVRVKNGKYTAGDGACKIDCDTVSGDVILRTGD